MSSKSHRITMATLMLRKGVPAAEVVEMGRWKDEEIMRTYIELMQQNPSERHRHTVRRRVSRRGCASCGRRGGSYSAVDGGVGGCSSEHAAHGERDRIGGGVSGHGAHDTWRRPSCS